MKRVIIIILFLTSICFGDTFTSHLKPNATGNLDIGTTSLLWRYIYSQSFTDGTANWTSNSLSGFTSISGTTLTDGIFTVSGGIISTGTWQGSTITVPYGGTGATSLTDGGLLVGSGTSAITALGVASNGQIPIGDGTTDPVLATVTGGSGITVTNAAGSITLDVNDSGVDHGGLIGLGDVVDHLLYLDLAGTRDLTGNWTISTNNIILTNGTLDANELVVNATTLVVNASGYPDKVGIGTASPTFMLDIRGGAPRVSLDISSGAGDAFIAFQEAGSNKFGITYDPTAESLLITKTISSSATDGIVIDSSGNVGIGTASPADKLYVVHNQTGISGITLRNTQAAAAGVGGAFKLLGVGAKTMAWIESQWEGAADTDAFLRFQVRGSDAPSEMMRITSAGNVGIGTASPGETLEVAGNIAVTGVAGDDVYIYRNAGTGIRIRSDSLTTQWWAGDDGPAYFGTVSNDDLHIQTNNNNRITIKSGAGSGNVGIGEVAPQDKLEVNGTILVKDKLKFTQDDGAEYIDSDADGTLDLYAGTSIDLHSGVIVPTINGIDYTPGSDTDTDLITVNVTGTPKLFWDEATDSFEMNKNLTLPGVLHLFEITTPTAITNYGAIYTKNINELFFQDGAGVEHLLHGDAFSNIWFASPSTVPVVISAEDTFTVIDSFTVVGHQDDLSNVVGDFSANTLTLSSIAAGEYEVSYHASVTATGGADKNMLFVFGITLAIAKDITDVTDDTVTPIVITSVAHGFENGDMVQIVDVDGNTAARGSFFVAGKTDNTFQIVALDNTATTGNGDYNEGSPTGDITIEYPGNMMIRRAVRGADLGAISATGVHILANSDVLKLYVANLDGVTDLTVASVSFEIDRIGD